MEKSVSPIDGMRDKIGEKLGASPWFTVTQEQIDQFGAVTHDPDPMHIDPSWCAEHSPFHSTIAFGFLTISMLTNFNRAAVAYDESGTSTSGGYALNYGFDRLRLIAPVVVGSRIRAHFTLLEVRDRAPGEVIVKTHCEIEIEGESRPALIAEWLGMWVTGPGHDRVSHDFNAARGNE